MSPIDQPFVAPPATTVYRYLAAREFHDSRIGKHVFAPATNARAIAGDGTLEVLPQTDAWALIDSSTSVPTYQRQRNLDQSRRLALVETYGEWSTYRMTELLLVVQVHSGWQIVGRAFSRNRLGSAALEADPVEEAHIRECLYACTDEPPAERHITHLVDCRYTFAGAAAPVYRYVSDPTWNLGRLGVVRKSRLVPHVVIELRGAVAAAKIVRNDRITQIINHVLLVKAEGTWRIADVTCSTPAPL